MSQFTLVFTILISFVFAGCIQTRRDIEKSESSKELVQMQAQKDSLENQVSDLQTDLRDMMGRLGTLEKQRLDEVEQGKESDDTTTQKNEERIKAYEETIVMLESQVKDLQVETAALKKLALNSIASKKSRSKAKAPRGPFYVAEASFKTKDWQKAITGYQSYREKYPKGRKYKDATYKIGVCFQELGMLTEAKAFFDEVIERYPKTSEARKAQRRLKSL